MVRRIYEAVLVRRCLSSEIRALAYFNRRRTLAKISLEMDVMNTYLFPRFFIR